MEFIISFIELQTNRQLRIISFLARIILLVLFTNSIMITLGYHFDQKFDFTIAKCVSYFLNGHILRPILLFSVLYLLFTYIYEFVADIIALFIYLFLKSIKNPGFRKFIDPISVGHFINVLATKDEKIVRGSMYDAAVTLQNDIEKKDNNVYKGSLIFASTLLLLLFTTHFYEIGNSHLILQNSFLLFVLYFQLNHVAIAFINFYSDSYLREMLKAVNYYNESAVVGKNQELER